MMPDPTVLSHLKNGYLVRWPLDSLRGWNRLSPAIDWCQGNLGPEGDEWQYSAICGGFKFLDSRDAMMFSMVWI
jgi:hypothetical protein